MCETFCQQRAMSKITYPLKLPTKGAIEPICEFSPIVAAPTEGMMSHGTPFVHPGPSKWKPKHDS
jgi:hypothetical protein